MLPQLSAQNKIVDSMINWVNKTNKIDSQYILTLHRISYRQSEKDIRQSFAYYEKVSYYSDSLNFLYGKSLAQINLGILLNIAANFDASNKSYFTAIDYAEASGALRLKAVSLNNIGENFLTLRDFEKSRQYTKEAIDINTKLKAWRGVAINYEQLQKCDLDEQFYNNAKANLLKGMPFALLSNDSYVLSQFYVGFGKLQAINNKIDSAVFYFTKAIDEARQQGDLKNEYNVYLAQVQYLKILTPKEKLSLLKKASKIAIQTGYLQGISDAARQMSIVYDELKNKDSSLAYYRIYRNTADSLFSEKNKRNVIIKESEWMIKRKEIENIHLKEFAVLQTRDLVIKNYLLLALAVLLILTIAFAIVFYKFRENKKKRTEAALKQQIVETEIAALMAQMKPHFIFNCISSIDGLIQGDEKYNATRYLNKFAKLIRNILDSSKLPTIEFTKDTETLQLYLDLEQLRSENKYRTHLHISAEMINSDYRVPPLVIQPFVENAIHHGLRNRQDNNGLLVINILREEDTICYSITDNGIGRTASAKLGKHNHQSYGIKMSTDRIKMFNLETTASVIIEDLFENEQASGTRVTVKLMIK
jgi:hypothetical protein